MRRSSESTRCCHIVWATTDGRSWFKIAAAARFCEEAIQRASAAFGWRLDLLAVCPSKVHLLVTVPLKEDRRTISRRLQREVTRRLALAGLIPPTPRALWQGDGWCTVLANEASVATVRRVLRQRACPADPPGVVSGRPKRPELLRFS